jgi:ABC-type bacteriocin/lantibiotic exporter with double-glycine peptidase domain
MNRALAAAALISLSAAAAGCHFTALSGPVTPRLDVQTGDRGWQLVPQVPLVEQRGASDCGVAALTMVLRYWQPDTPGEAIRAALPLGAGESGLAAARLRNLARDRGFSAFLVQGTLDDLAHEVEQRRPVIVGLVRIAGRRALAHYVVVVGVNRQDGRVLEADPQLGWREPRVDEFLTEWQRARSLALMILPSAAQARR